MKWVKAPLTVLERLKCLWSGVEGFSQTWIDVYEEKKWHIEYYPWHDRWDCFLSELLTAAVGYRWRLCEGEYP